MGHFWKEKMDLRSRDEELFLLREAFESRSGNGELQAVSNSLPILPTQFLRVRIFFNLINATTATVRIGIYAKWKEGRGDVSQEFSKGFTDVVLTAGGTNEATATIPVYYGNLFSVSAQVVADDSSLGIQRGEIFCSVELMDGPAVNAQLIHQLLSNYLSSGRGASWPTSAPDSENDAEAVNAVTVADPGAGNQVQVICPAHTQWQILSFKFTLETDATPASRTVQIEDFPLGIFDMAFLTHIPNPLIYHEASLTQSYCFSNLPGPAGPSAGLILPGSLAGLFLLRASDELRTRIGSFQAGDIISNIVLVVKQSISPSP